MEKIKTSTPDDQVNDFLNVIDALKQQKEDLLKEKARILQEINKPIYEAKEKCEKMLAETKIQADDIMKQAMEKYKEADKQAQKVNELERALKSDYTTLKEKQDKLEKDRKEFESIKYSAETNLQQLKMQTDGLYAQAIKMQEEAKQLKIHLDSRESLLNSKEINLQDKANLISQKEENIAYKEKIIIDGNKAIEENKLAIEISREQIKKDEENINQQRTHNEGILEEASKVKSETEKILADIDQQKLNVSKQLNELANRKEELKELERTIEDKQRLNQRVAKQLDEKIATLNKLREDNEQGK